MLPLSYIRSEEAESGGRESGSKGQDLRIETAWRRDWIIVRERKCHGHYLRNIGGLFKRRATDAEEDETGIERSGKEVIAKFENSSEARRRDFEREIRGSAQNCGESEETERAG